MPGKNIRFYQPKPIDTITELLCDYYIALLFFLKKIQ